MCKGKNFIDFPIGNIYKTNKFIEQPHQNYPYFSVRKKREKMHDRVDVRRTLISGAVVRKHEDAVYTF